MPRTQRERRTFRVYPGCALIMDGVLQGCADPCLRRVVPAIFDCFSTPCRGRGLLALCNHTQQGLHLFILPIRTEENWEHPPCEGILFSLPCQVHKESCPHPPGPHSSIYRSSWENWTKCRSFALLSSASRAQTFECRRNKLSNSAPKLRADVSIYAGSSRTCFSSHGRT